jgi:FdhD protein
VTRRVAVTSVTRCSPDTAGTDQDLVAVEAPLSLRVRATDGAGEHSFGLLMRTPGDDEDLALGLLYAEGIIAGPEDVAGVEIAASVSRDQAEHAIVTLAPHVHADWTTVSRHTAATTACGLCGRAAMPATRRADAIDVPRIARAVIATLPERLRGRQNVFDETGGLHAAAIFTVHGEARVIREDVGRHNAVDKVIGALFRERGLPAAGIVILVAVGAPSSLAVEASRAAGLTLIGFARDARFNIYTGAQRVI